VFVRQSFLAAVAGASLLAACTPPEAVSPPVETASLPAQMPTPAAGSTPTAPQPRAVRIRAAVSDRALAGATLTVRRADTLAVVAEGLALDAEGAITLPLDERLPAGTAVVVQAGTGTAALSGLFVVSEPAYAVQQATGTEWLLDLATSAVTRKLASKVADVVRSLPPGSSPDTLSAFMRQIDALASKAREAFQAGIKDVSTADALRLAAEKPTKENIESLANGLIRRAGLQTDFVNVVEACNRQAIANMKAGGPLVQPSRWQVYEVSVPPVLVRASGANEVEIIYGNEKATVTVADAANRVAEATQRVTDAASNADFAELNTNVVVASSSGSAGGSSQPPSLQGTISVGDAARGGAVVQLSKLDGTIVATTVSSANGAYAFYGIQDGVYHLTVAVDGAVQTTRQVTIGNPAT
jgi:hypothetical protein